jgi:hypothetical protein
MSVTPGMPVHGTNRTNRTNRTSLMMSDNRMKPRARQTEVSANSATIYVIAPPSFSSRICQPARCACRSAPSAEGSKDGGNISTARLHLLRWAHTGRRERRCLFKFAGGDLGYFFDGQMS